MLGHLTLAKARYSDAPEADPVGKYFCWDWASAFVGAANKVHSDIWWSFFRRFNSNSSDTVHFAARIYIVHSKNPQYCQVSIDDGYFQDGMIHRPGWPSRTDFTETFHNLVPGTDTLAPLL